MLIYKATSKTTNKVYIGQTTTTLQNRINHHKTASEVKNYHFYNAIKKYGFDDFEWEVLEDDIHDINLLNEREKYWINYYNSYEDGYNSTRGGEGYIRRDDEIILKLFVEGLSVQEICKITGYSRNTIYRSFQENSLTEDNNNRNKLKIQQRCGFPVLQYDLNGNFIKEWPSASSCKEIGNQSAISLVCNQLSLSAYGYLWKYKHDERNINEWVIKYKNKKSAGKPKKKIMQLDESHNLIQIFDSGADAARYFGLSDKSNICAAARNHRKCQGYYWEYVKE